MVRPPFDRTEPLQVHAEEIGEAPTPWAFAIYRGDRPLLITRSHAVYRKREDAVDAGMVAAKVVGNRLRVEVDTTMHTIAHSRQGGP